MSRRKAKPSVPGKRGKSGGGGRDGDVGYGRPPRKHQFQPGQSGNPKGRPKGSKNESTILREILNRKLQISRDGRPRKITVLEGVHLRIAEDALKGNVKSAAFLLNRYAAMVSGDIKPSELGDDDQKVLDAFARRFTSKVTPE